MFSVSVVKIMYTFFFIMIHLCVMHLHVFLIISIVALLRNLNYVLYKVIGALNRLQWKTYIT